MNYQNIGPKEFKSGYENAVDAVLIDVRRPEEIAVNKIPGAIELDFYAADFAEKVLSLDKDKTYYIYCRSGNRSGQACGLMAQNGFANTINLAGGMLAWDVTEW
jgi:rhodanese-related sulfurtransferase